MNTQWSRVTGHAVTAGQVIYVAANGSRSRVEFAASYTPGYVYGTVYVDTVISGNVLGQLTGDLSRRLKVTKEDHGDLPQRRFAVKVDSVSAGAMVSVLEVIDTKVSGG